MSGKLFSGMVIRQLFYICGNYTEHTTVLFRYILFCCIIRLGVLIVRNNFFSPTGLVFPIICLKKALFQGFYVHLINRTH